MSNQESSPTDASPHRGTVDPALAGLEPVSVWRHFSDLARIPRCTGNEQGVRDYVEAFARSQGIACEINEVGDVLLRVHPDAAGRVVAVQAHMDMVCVANAGTPVDFARDPIRLRREGDLLSAAGTSLGADNGIGVAYALALAEQVDGPLEVLLTVDEEEGFTGIEGVAPDWLCARSVINLDSEEEGFVTIASAGACDFTIRLAVTREAADVACDHWAVTIGGLKGGHSGVEIHRGRTNALDVAGRLLSLARQCGGVGYELSGGSAPNVIPSEATVLVGIPPARTEEFRARTAELGGALRTEEDPALALEVRATDPRCAPLTSDTLSRLVALLDRIPTGVLVPSPRDPAQPFVSNNLGVVREADGRFELTLMSRSPASAELEALADRYRMLAQAEGAELVAGRLVPGWAPDYGSPLLALFQQKHEEQYGRAAEVLEIHAGLECGALKAKYPDMDLISVGPDIFGAHSTEERVSIASTARVFELVRNVIRALRHGP